MKVRDARIGESGKFGLFPKMTVHEIKKDTIVLHDGFGGTKEVSFEKFEKFFTPLKFGGDK